MPTAHSREISGGSRGGGMAGLAVRSGRCGARTAKSRDRSTTAGDISRRAETAAAPDVRTITRPVTPRDVSLQPSTTGLPPLAGNIPAKGSGIVERPLSQSLDDMRKMPSTELVGASSVGNRRPRRGLERNGRWPPYAAQVLEQARVKRRPASSSSSGRSRERGSRMAAHKSRVEPVRRRLTHREGALTRPMAPTP